MRPRRHTPLALLLCLLAALVSCQAHDAAHLDLTGTVEITRLTLASRVGGRVATHAVSEGETVAAGAIVITLTEPALAAQASVLAAQRAQAEATLAELEAGARPEEVAQARAVLAAAESRLHLLEAGSRAEERALARTEADLARAILDQAERDASRARDLFAAGVIAQQELEQIELTRTRAADQWRLADQRLQLAEAGPRPEEVAILRAQVAQQQAQVALLEAGPTPEALERARQLVRQAQEQEAALSADLAELEVRTPRAGVVDRLLLDPGEVAMPGQALCSLRDPADVRLRVWLPESQLGRVQPGNTGTVTLHGDQPPLQVTVVTIASQAEFTPRNIQTPQERATQVFAMDCRFTDPPDWLRDGMTLTVRFDPTTP
ncbi:MAG: hypothetical protein GEEBNDBF_01460 [bacterium]|nr:hypothetical protein [bacterium]